MKSETHWSESEVKSFSITRKPTALRSSSLFEAVMMLLKKTRMAWFSLNYN